MKSAVWVPVRPLMFGMLALGLGACTTAMPISTGAASVSSPIALSADGRTVWVVNPDADSVTAIDASTLHAAAPIAVGDEPWSVAVTPSGTVVVANRASGSLSLLSGSARTDVDVGPELGGLALSPSGRAAYVSVSSTNEVAVVNLERRTVANRTLIGRLPWAVAVAGDTDDSATVVVTHRSARLRAGGSETEDNGKEGWLSVLSGTGLREVTIAAYGFGFANALEGLALSGDRVWVAHLLDAPGNPRTFNQTVSAALSSLSLTAHGDARETRIHLNDTDFSTPINFPRAVVIGRGGTRAYVVLAGTNAVMGVDLTNPNLPKLVGFWPVGENPRGLVLSRDGRTAYVMNYLSRDVSVLDLADETSRREVGRIKVAPETLSPRVLRGKILFNNANDPRLSRLGWISCASCHFDGGTDGTTWLTPDGPRQTLPLWQLEGTAPFHASGTRDEVQDVEHDIETLMDGVGLAPGMAIRELGPPSAGTSSDLDALAEFVSTAIRVPRAAAIGNAAQTRGRQVFVQHGCAVCHGGPHWTTSVLPGPVGSLAPSGEIEVVRSLHDVGTFRSGFDVLGKHGFDVPTLLGLHATAPYLHDGSAATLEAVLDRSAHNGIVLSASQTADLIDFLNHLDDRSAPVLP